MNFPTSMTFSQCCCRSGIFFGWVNPIGRSRRATIASIKAKMASIKVKIVSIKAKIASIIANMATLKAKIAFITAKRASIKAKMKIYSCFWELDVISDGIGAFPKAWKSCLDVLTRNTKHVLIHIIYFGHKNLGLDPNPDSSNPFLLKFRLSCVLDSWAWDIVIIKVF